MIRCRHSGSARDRSRRHRRHRGLQHHAVPHPLPDLPGRADHRTGPAGDHRGRRRIHRRQRPGTRPVRRVVPGHGAGAPPAELGRAGGTEQPGAGTGHRALRLLHRLGRLPRVGGVGATRGGGRPVGLRRRAGPPGRGEQPAHPPGRLRRDHGRRGPVRLGAALVAVEHETVPPRADRAVRAALPGGHAGRQRPAVHDRGLRTRPADLGARRLRLLLRGAPAQRPQHHVQEPAPGAVALRAGTRGVRGRADRARPGA